MMSMRARCALFGIVLAGAAVTPALAQDAPRVAISTSVNYSVGDYGTGKDTTLLYVPFTLGVRPLDRLWLSVTIPYIYQSTQNVVLTGGGVAVRGKGSGKLARPAGSTTESGLGDVLAKAAFVLVEEKDFGVDLGKRLVGGLFGYLGLAYTFIGDPPATDLRDSFAWSVGAAWAVTTPLSVFAFLEGATAVTPGEADPLEIRVGAEYRLTQALKLTGTVTRGLSDGSADWGLSAGLALRF